MTKQREIKFRAWLPEYKKMVVVDMLSLSGGSNVGFHLGPCIGHENIFKPEGGCKYVSYFSEGVKLVQYTGLKDKNGKEIYEGDIVTVPIPETDYKTREVGEVVFWDLSGGWEIMNGMNDGFRSLYGKEQNQLEVIGNRFENPELLKEYD